MRKFLSLLLLLFSASSAAQSVQQSGSVTPNHPVRWVTNGVVGDGGTAANPVFPSIGTLGQGPTICANSAAISGPYTALCFAPYTSQASQITLFNYNGAANDGLVFNINGTLYSFPYTVGGIVGPASSTVSDMACWNNATGSLLKDCGIPATIGGSNGQLQYNNSGVFGGFTLAGDCTLAVPNITCTKTSGVAFAASATTDTTNATNIGSGTLADGRLSSNVPLKNGSNVFSGVNTFSGGSTFSGNAQYTGSAQQFYVATIGSDSNDCLTSGTACLTLQHTINVALQYDAKNARSVVNVGTGSFAVGAMVAGPLRGEAFQGTAPGLEISGAGSGLTTIDDNTSNCGTLVLSNIDVYVHDLKIQNTSTGCGGAASGIFAQAHAYFAWKNIAWGLVGGQHIHLEGNSRGEQVGNDSMTGNAQAHVGLSASSNFVIDGYTTTCSGITAFSQAYIYGQTNSTVQLLTGTTFTSCGSVTGLKYALFSGAGIDADGSTSLVSSIPGTTAGTLVDGAYYTPVVTAATQHPFVTLGATVNFNSANTDTAFPITIPSGFTRYRVNLVTISGASGTLTTATAGLFTGSGGAGLAIVTGGSAITVSTGAENTNNNLQFMSINNSLTQDYTAATLYFRVGTAEGAAATAIVTLQIQWIS